MAGGQIREGRFVRLNVGETREAYEAALPHEAPDAVKTRLAELWPAHSRSLIQALDARMVERTKGLQKFLDERCSKEIEDMKAVLNELERSIREELKEPQAIQLTFWSLPEQDQFERNKNSLKARLARIPQEIELEANAIRARYANPVPRLFPVAVTYLVPEKLAR